MYYIISLLFFFSLSTCVRAQTNAGATVSTEPVGTPAQTLTAMSYNLRLDFPGDSLNAWPHRRDFLLSQLLFHAPDIIGTQEGLPEQIAWLDKRLPGYGRVGQGREGGNRGEYSAIYYNRERFAALTSGTLWLSETPNVVSVGWDAALPRIVSWVRLAERGGTGGGEFYAFNTHFDHRGARARVKSAKLILRMIDSINTDGLPVVLTGDLNLTPETPALQQLTARLTDAYAAAPVRLGPAGTFNAFRYDRPAERRIDYILVSHQIDVERFATLTDARDGRYPSDHFPVLAQLKLHHSLGPEALSDIQFRIDYRTKVTIDSLATRWHRAAARADSAAFFGALAPESYYLGTDKTEHWTKAEFLQFAAPYFARGEAWAFTATERNVFLAADGSVGWWDEVLDTWMGPCRGTGVVERADGVWKIRHYTLSMLVPNERVRAVVEVIGEGK